VSDILDLIDSAVRDWETSPDAVRYNAPPPVPTVTRYGPRMGFGDHEVPVTSVEIEFDTVPMPPLGATAIRMASEFQRRTATLSRGERGEFTTYWQSGPWTMEQAWERWVGRRQGGTVVELSAFIGDFATAMCLARESALALSRTLRLEPWPHGWNEPCFCHPAPFPAARDYRRRTKHRNRRRKR